ncbi:MAG: uridine diphosphate-N-acetylglucosamine-binding protein YvcK [Actinomycetota bacterium]|nr:uridine diphosphate-N-acetylglucosamine-binding protein YvcK [Actinomycetota bacterium]MDK1017444.1 uridine diphosphate-N-acetylglucosamine-binding protein YvcK [Actinomycetota bacterium]MDK1039345.1 uridine diphosphate-N-acetylglucosamine-binding protein YvcK [Actinomycetota bacterium]MDK1097475.1 uridine diphosphate-N-acetylglucosamine-binding protein YvcK [Actinomycetota bacterium]
MPRTHAEPEAVLDALQRSLDGPRVVAIGGGEGLSRVLKAALGYASRVDAVVTVSDDGGSSGRLVRHLDIPPPGDMRKCLLALTPEDSIWRDVFDYRFAGADVAGHSLGNLILAGLAGIEGSFEEALARAGRLLGAYGSVIPASREHLQLEIESGREIVRGQVSISLHRGSVDSIRVNPESAEATPRAIEVISSADQIVLGPGSLMTSTIAALRVPGITEAVNSSSAQLVYVGNLVTQDGETLDMDGIDHIEALVRLTGVRPPRTIVANNRSIDVASPLTWVAFDSELAATYGADLEESDLVDEQAASPSHAPDKLGEALRAITP